MRFLYLLLLTSCVAAPSRRFSSDDFLLQPNASLESPGKLSSQEAAEDSAALLFALETGYGGRKYVPGFGEATEELRRVLRQSKDTSTVEYCARLSAILSKLPDNHLAARLSGNDCGVVTGEKGKVGTNVSVKIWDVLKRGGVTVIAITAFPSHEDEKWEGFLDAVQLAKRSAQAIILDLRGNGGGDDTMGRRLVGFLYGQDYPKPHEAVAKSQTPMTFVLAANNVQLKMRRNGAEYLELRKKKFLELYEEAKAGRLPEERLEAGDAGYPFDAKKAYTKPIYVLIDRGCQSSCESTLEALEAHPFVTTVGENTGGYVHFGNMGQLVLPHSRITVQLATDYWRFKDGRFVEKSGYAPKVRVLEGGDALASALELLRVGKD